MACQLTVSAGLNGCLNVTNALDGDTVLVVAVDKLVLQLTDLVDENAEFVGDVGNIIITSLAPDGELLLQCLLARAPLNRLQRRQMCFQRTATSMRSLPTSSIDRITFFSIFTSCDSFLARSGPKAPGCTDLRKVWPAGTVSRRCK